MAPSTRRFSGFDDCGVVAEQRDLYYVKVRWTSKEFVRTNAAAITAKIFSAAASTISNLIN